MSLPDQNRVSDVCAKGEVSHVNCTINEIRKSFDLKGYCSVIFFYMDQVFDKV